MTTRTEKEDVPPNATKAPRSSREPPALRRIFMLIWLSISLMAGLAGHFFFKLNFWAASVIAAVALTINGLADSWGDRRER